MALKNLTDNEMVEVSSAWVDPKRGRGALEAHPLLAALLPSVEAAHAGLLAGDGPRGGDEARDKERAGLYAQGVALDQRHDRKGRGAFNLLSALADLSDDPSEAEALLSLRQAVFPEGNLSVLAASWKGEAGNARRVHDKVLGDKAHVAALKAVPLTGRRTLLDGVRDFVGAGQKLGVLEDQRVALGEPLASTDARSGRAKARNRWIAVGNNLVRLVDDLLELDATERHALLGALSDAEARADARALARRPVEDAGDPVKPIEGTGEG
jgi:hypothetical protein